MRDYVFTLPELATGALHSVPVGRTFYVVVHNKLSRRERNKLVRSLEAVYSVHITKYKQEPLSMTDEGYWYSMFLNGRTIHADADA